MPKDQQDDSRSSNLTEAKPLMLLTKWCGCASVNALPHDAAGMVVMISAETTEIAVISLAGIVMSRSMHVGSKAFDECITEHMQRVHNLEIGPRMAKAVKSQIGSACPLETELTMEMRGRDRDSGLAKSVRISSEEIRPALQEPLALLMELLQTVSERCPPDLVDDLRSLGVLIIGSAQLLRGFDQLVSKATGLSVSDESGDLRFRASSGRY
jgi:rod shape-determining protein MreB and related proteins